MSRKIETRTVDGVEFASQQLPVLRAYKLMAKLARTVASGKATTVFDLMGALEPETCDAFVIEVLGATTARTGDKVIGLGSRENINTVFEGKLDALCEVIAWALEVNFGNFFGADSVTSAGSAVAAASPAASEPAST